MTMRSVAAEAGVDAALVSYFFGSKKGLFGAALALPANPPELLRGALAGDPASLPERVLGALVRAWDDPVQGGPLRAMVDRGGAGPGPRPPAPEVLEREMIDRIAEHLGGADARYRAAAFASQLSGVVFSRYLMRLEPVASMDVDELTRFLAPGLRAALHGPRPVRR